MIRVLHIHKITGIAGSERHLLTLLPRLDRSRIAVSMLMLEEPGRAVDAFASEMQHAGIVVKRVTVARDLDPICWWNVRAAIRDAGVDIVHTHLIHGDVYGVTAAASMLPRPAVISSKHGYDNYDRTSRFYRVGRLLNPAIDRVVTISQALQEKVAAAEGLPRRKMVTIHYGLDLPATAEPVVPSEPLRLVSVGRLVPVKGFQHLLRAIAALGPDAQRVTLTLVGDGPERQALMALAEQLGISSRVRFAGWQKDVSRFLREAHVFVLPTLGEGFGLAVLEAMGEARPVVASNTMSLPEIVAHGETGLLVPPADPDALAAAMRACLGDPTRLTRMGVAGRARGMAQFSVARMVDRTQQLYEEIMERRH